MRKSVSTDGATSLSKPISSGHMNRKFWKGAASLVLNRKKVAML